MRKINMIAGFKELVADIESSNKKRVPEKSISASADLCS